LSNVGTNLKNNKRYDMKSKRIIGWILIIVGILFYAFFKKYHGDLIPFPIIFYLIGFSMIIAGFFILRKTPKIEQIKLIEKAEKLKAELKANGQKIEVDLNDCEIKENHYFEKPDYSKNYTDFELINFYELAMFYETIKGTKNDSEIKQSVILTKIQLNGLEKKVRSSMLPYDRVKLMFSFNEQKKTYVYIDKSDSEKYYFDFEFLREKK
jgi:hypothetical protein